MSRHGQDFVIARGTGWPVNSFDPLNLSLPQHREGVGGEAGVWTFSASSISIEEQVFREFGFDPLGISRFVGHFLTQ